MEVDDQLHASAALAPVKRHSTEGTGGLEGHRIGVD
jgi:hypothetical protein